MRDARILVVDDDESVCAFCATTLSRFENVTVTAEHRSGHALKLCQKGGFDLVLTDLSMPDTDGVQILRASKSTNPDVPVIIMTGYPSLDNSVECLRLGASDYVLKPLRVDDLLVTVSRVLDERRLQQENHLLRSQLEKKSSTIDLLGVSEPINDVRESIRTLAETDVDVLIWGETGTGKELVARNIHANSDRATKPFVPVDCSAIPPDLFESEFFGHERGAFTGATQRALGLMEYADGGTLFLDEIGELLMPQQAKLLRAIQERSFRRVGSREEIEVDIRILAATNRDLRQEVAAKRFRDDLFFRINVGEIKLPPLRERQADIELLLVHYLESYGREMKRSGRELKPEVLQMLRAYTWPGNVRELINVVRRMLAMSRRKLMSVDDVPEDVRTSVGVLAESTTEASDGSSQTGSSQTGSSQTGSSQTGSSQTGFLGERTRMLRDIEREYYETMLRSCNGEIMATARIAKVSRQTVYRALARLGIDPNDFRDEGSAQG